VTIDAHSGRVDVVRRGMSAQIDERFISRPESIEYETEDGPAYGFYYPPTNPDFEPAEDELPPLIVSVHGGPTAHTLPVLELEIQFFTSRGFAVCDLNYGGSTGYGRAFRDRLRGRWGEVDVHDAEAAARALVQGGLADPDRIVITGGSAGGYTTLMAMGVSDVFAAGISEFGVADLVTFHNDTHKFESRYDEYLVGKWPEEVDLYRDRSPVSHADSISRPLLLLQGLDDKVVPPAQAEVIVEALEQRGVPYAYIAFAGEGHGFRKSENAKRALEAHLSFLAQIFGFEPADHFQPIEIENLERVAR
jgi:dipeptidyl aminopeptidase/acylaminoacyl peptidase